MVSVTDLAVLAVALVGPVCVLASVALVVGAAMASSRNAVLERTVEVLTRRLVALQARQAVMVVDPSTGRSRDAISMGPPITDEPAPDPNGLVDPSELLRGAREASAGDWEPKLDRRAGGN